MTARTGSLDFLDGKSSTLFLGGGALLAVFAVNTALRTFVGTSFPPVQGLVGPVGFLLGVLGLVGLYANLADRTPLLARVALLVAVIPAVGWPAIILRGIATQVLGLSVPEALAALPMVVIASMFLSFAIFGLASLYARIHGWLVGVLLFVPATGFLLLLTNAAPHIIIDIGHAMGYLGVGITLRTGAIGPDSADPVADATP